MCGNRRDSFSLAAAAAPQHRRRPTQPLHGNFHRVTVATRRAPRSIGRGTCGWRTFWEVSTETDERAAIARDDAALVCLREVHARLESLPAELRRAAAVAIPERAPASTIVTGIGGSEGPARLFAMQLSAHSCVRFVPLSSFVGACPKAERLVVFSQGLSPNARLALGRRHDFAETIVVGAMEPDAATSAGESEVESERRRFARALRDDGVVFVTHGPPSESGMLVRLVGPTVASSIALRLAASFGGAPFDAEQASLTYASCVRESFASVASVLSTTAPTPNWPSASTFKMPASGSPASPTSSLVMLASVPSSAPTSAPISGPTSTSDPATTSATFEPLSLDAPIALVAAGELVEALFGLRWKWLETFGADPHVFDVLACAHGPLQALYERPATWLAFESTGSEELVTRLGRVLPKRHVLRRVRVSDDPAIAFFEATAHLDACLLTTLTARPRDLRRWPGRGADGALYDLGR